MEAIVPIEAIDRKIYLIRGHKVMLDRDLAELYDVETRVLNQAVRRNIDRFPPDFMFSLTREEIMRISQIVISSMPDETETLKFAKNVQVFTEHGVAMLSSVLNSPRAIQVNIQIMRAFAKLREIISANKDLSRRLDTLEKKYDAQFKVIFDAIRQLMAQPEPKKKKIGFTVRERSMRYRTLIRKDVKKINTNDTNSTNEDNKCSFLFVTFESFV